MINLIPQHARRRVVIEYWCRVVSVWLLLLGSALLIIAVLNLPVYVLLSGQKEAYSQQYREAAAVSVDLETSQETIMQTNAIARLLAQAEAPVPFTDYITRLEALQSEEVAIREVRLHRNAEKLVGEIQLAGRAATRQSLADFRRTIEGDELFTAVELPISNLAKDENILFSITVTPAKLSDV